MARAFKCDHCGKLVEKATTKQHPEIHKLDKAVVLPGVYYNLVPAWSSEKNLDHYEYADVCPACEIDILETFVKKLKVKYRKVI